MSSCRIEQLTKHLTAVQTYMYRDINVVVVPGVYVNGMEASTRTVNDLQPLTLLHCEVDKDRPVRQVCERLVKRSGGFGG